jgi:hypothetical protein
MIQRIQTFFLADVIVLTIVLLFVPIYHVAIPNQTGFLSNPDAVATFVQFPTLLQIPVLLAVSILQSVIAVVAILMYKNRLIQMRVCRSGLLISLLVAVNAAIFPQWFIRGQKDPSAIQPAIGAWLLFVPVILFFLAHYFVKKDEALVRSADRLR